ncbi:dihydrodipicolinate synthase family protein [Propionicimonas sp.]|uniref:dihydrodipicolinate synthase family protein n=1 Tax=Propionicimonas sp. TaxID=1955623 RepID=UPI00178E619F|nr:dihydrodipicolinate synthase family protein [Propionicimonas sp.]MBU3977897.1 dihydrodipicolinate synthase family protein [Actinomycetota bacterium]MBA3021880.1 dihydrodipicolinate synthase family protein [Propionicimonas sp.]MBU3985341.1 dihydrodipicolinate synthase family protein [Actinomycetota bacterium]MBU4007396.1 dihydrodipicolinate synthase family protein [Actinomycetota bacterium]MBU4065658.1 dihydrodipicolinate synthase family protein [Actinomycetota bacterium]
MTATPLLGVLPVLQTPFGARGELDLDVLAQEVDWVLDQGVAGVTTGMVSELLRLTESERTVLTEVVVSVARRRGAISVISCGAESTRTSVAMARHAAEAGADAVMINPPLTAALDAGELAKHFSAIVEAISIPMVVQDASGYVGQPLSLNLQLSLLDRYPDQVYFKPEASPIGQRLSRLRDLTGGRARILEGTGGAALLDSYRRGIVGTMPGAEVCWAVQRLWSCLESGDWPTAYRLSGILNAMIGMQTSLDAFVAVEKHLLVRQGVFTSSAVRTPSSFLLDAETGAEIDRLFDLLVEAAAEPAEVA